MINYGVINSVLEKYAAYITKLTSNNSPYNTKLFKCHDSENSLSFKSYGLFYEITIVLFSWETSSQLVLSMESNLIATPSYTQRITSKERHPLITFIATAMASDIVWLLYNL